MGELEIGQRFKRYEAVTSSLSLTPRTPVIIRVDGRAFHTLTKRMHLDKPFDTSFLNALIKVAHDLCKEMHPVLGYVQSDEASFVLLDDRKYESQGWFNGEIQKMTSVSASVAASAFSMKMDTPCSFDSRAFNIPHHEVANYFIWRQLDAIRNARNVWSEFTLGGKIGRGTARDRLDGLPARERILLTEAVTGKSFEDIDARFRRGVEFRKVPVGRKVWSAVAPPEYVADRDYLKAIFRDYYADGDCPTRDFEEESPST